MTTYILARAIATICARNQGLFKIVLPRSLGQQFKATLCETFAGLGGTAVPVGTGENELSPGEAIAYRTPEDGDGPKSILLVATEGQIKELKSLETYRDVLVGGMPGGLDSEGQAILRSDLLADEIAKLVCSTSDQSLNQTKLSEMVARVLAFLAKAYGIHGNDEKRWTDAFWRHLDVTTNNLVWGAAALPSGTPDYERDLAFACAGLPRPDRGPSYAQSHDAAKYVKVIASGWSDAERIEMSLVRIQEESTTPEEAHPLQFLPWPDFITSRTVLGHPLLAVAHHGLDNREAWLHGWASTAEKGFFAGLRTGALDVELSWRSGGADIHVAPAKWKGLDFVLPPGINKILPGNTLSLGSYKLLIKVEEGESPEVLPVTIAAKPANACIVKNAISTLTENGIEVVFDLERKLAAKTGKWREKPFTLTITPARVVAGAQFCASLSMTCYAPNPATPSVLALEEAKRGGTWAPIYPVDAVYSINKEAGWIDTTAGGEERDIDLSEDAPAARIVIIGAKSAPEFSGGATPSAASENTCPWLSTFDLPSPPQELTIKVDGATFPLTIPTFEDGEANPLLAAIRGVPVLVSDNGLEDEIEGDPRGLLELWLRDNLVATAPGNHVQKCLGSTLIEIGTSGGSRDLHWDDTLGAFTNCVTVQALKYPAELAQSPEATRFWEAFTALNLATCAGEHDLSALPSLLNLRKLKRDKVEAYLEAYAQLLDTLGTPKLHSWAAYPFSSLLYDTSHGAVQGVLLSPLHPLRLAWSWSVQFAGNQVKRNSSFEKVALSFLRFIDGEMFPAAGPATHGNARWLATGLAAGPAEIFVGWSLLSNLSLDGSNLQDSISIMGLKLPFGTPSGLDQGGVSAALRDYLRVFPAAQDLRIGLAAPRGGVRFAGTDEAIISAAGNLLAQNESRLPGGIRIIDANDRKGQAPEPSAVLDRLQAGSRGIGSTGVPPFEWRTEGKYQSKQTVDLQFVEDSLVNVETSSTNDPGKSVGSCGPTLPINRFRCWQMHAEHKMDNVSSFSLGIQEESFSGMANFAAALGKLERLHVSDTTVQIQATLQLGSTLLGKHAKWTISGNRHLNPSILSAQLSRAQGDVVLWEWRPAFLSRQKQKAAITSIASTHPYTVFARTSSTLRDEIGKVLYGCGMHHGPEDVAKVVTDLGIRGVGLSSLLTMGHTQSLGALGFNLAFRGLAAWESTAAPNEVRCVVPMDSIYPLLDLLGEGVDTPDDQQRADLLLVSAVRQEGGSCALRLHPIEVKMRTKEGSSFPGFSALGDPISQLANTYTVLDNIVKNLTKSGDLVLLRAALASLLEAAFALRPSHYDSDAKLQAEVLGAVASRPLKLTAERGTILWFQVGGRDSEGAPFGIAFPEGDRPGCVFIDPAQLDLPQAVDHVLEAISQTIDDVLDHVVEMPYPKEAVGLHNTAGESEGSVEAKPTYAATTNEVPQAVVPIVAEPILMQPAPSKEAAAEVSNVSQLVPAPPRGIEILLGEEVRGTKATPIYFKPSETALNQLNVGVVGDLGTGKTQFLKSLVYQLARSQAANRGIAPKVFLFDYKRDYSEGDFPEALGAQVLDPAKAPLPINFFAIDLARISGSVQMERVRRANFFCDLLRRIASIGVVQRNALYTVIMEAYSAAAEGRFPTINEVFLGYSELGKSDSVISTLTLLKDLAVFEPDSTKTKTFVELFDRTTVLNLGGLGGAGQDIVDIVATMFLDNLYTDYMKTRPKPPFITGDDGVSRRQVDSFVLIDEAHHAMGRDFDVLMKLMLEGREFGMGVILSSQYLSHFETGSHDWAEALSTWVVHNVRNASVNQFKRIGFKSTAAEMAEKVTSLKTHWAYYRCVNGHTEGTLMKGQPFFSLPK